jgi:hypothetical protein
VSVIQINVGDHTSPVPNYIAFPVRYRSMLGWARDRGRLITHRIPRADQYFKTLPLGRTLTQLFADNAIWVNYNQVMPYFGEAIIGETELAIGRSALVMGRWTTLGTLIHELAHINGAPGGNSTLAEEAVLAAGMGRASEKGGADDAWTPYDPNIEGQE